MVASCQAAVVHILASAQLLTAAADFMLLLVLAGVVVDGFVQSVSPAAVQLVSVVAVNGSLLKCKYEYFGLPQ